MEQDTQDFYVQLSIHDAHREKMPNTTVVVYISPRYCKSNVNLANLQYFYTG